MSVQDQSFVFSQNNGGFSIAKLTNSRSSGLGKQKDVGLNCLCIVFTDIIVLTNEQIDFTKLSEDDIKQMLAQDRIIRSKRALCMMFTNSLY